MIIFVDSQMVPQRRRRKKRKGDSRDPSLMTSTPTNGNSCFPFAINCKLTKTFFGVPRKCNHCHKMIVLTAGFACQFCRYRCHRKCMGSGPHPCSRPKLCSLSRLPSGDEELFSKLLRENEINSNEVDVFPDDWASILGRSDPRALCKTALEGVELSEEDEDAEAPLCLNVDSALLSPVEEQNEESVMERFLRLLPWNRTCSEDGTKPSSLPLPKVSSGACSSSGACPSSPVVVTPVDEFNYSVLEELFQQRSASTASASSSSGPLAPSKLLNRRLNWVRHITGDRSARSQDCVTDHRLFSPTRFSPFPYPTKEEDSVVACPRMKLSASWPLTGLHMNHDESEEEDGDLAQQDSEFNSDHSGRNSVAELGEWAIPHGDLEYEECQREGRQVRTFRGRWHGDAMIHRYQAEDLSKFLQDVHTLTKIRHENIALFMGACVEPPNLAVVTSIRKGDCLYDTIHFKQRRLSHQTKVNIAKQISQGVGYLHAKGIILKSLSSKGVFLECKVKICMVDYGGPSVAHVPENSGALSRGDLTYLSPELMTSLRVAHPNLVLDAPRKKPCDVYAFGTVLFEMFAGDFPLANLSPESVIWMIGSGQRQAVDALPCHVAMKSLIEDCWSPDPAYRPSFTQILRELHQTAALHKKRSSSEPEKMHKNSAQYPFRQHYGH